MKEYPAVRQTWCQYQRIGARNSGGGCSHPSNARIDHRSSTIRDRRESRIRSTMICDLYRRDAYHSMWEGFQQKQEMETVYAASTHALRFMVGRSSSALLPVQLWKYIANRLSIKSSTSRTARQAVIEYPPVVQHAQVGSKMSSLQV